MHKQKYTIIVFSLIYLLFTLISCKEKELPYTFITKWGSKGSGNGQFNGLSGITVDSSGNIYVVDCTNHRIQKFTPEGEFITMWGSKGSGDGQFYYPGQITINQEEDIFVTDIGNHRIQKFTCEGEFITMWGSKGSGDGQFYFPRGTAVDSDQYIYVTDSNCYIQKFTSDGKFVTKWEVHCSQLTTLSHSLEDITIDPSGAIYVVYSISGGVSHPGCPTRSYIYKLDKSGKFITRWGEKGATDKLFEEEVGIAISRDGNIFVADPDNSCIYKFNSSGKLMTEWVIKGKEEQISEPRKVIVNLQGNIYVVDSENYSIQMFTPNPNFK